MQQIEDAARALRAGGLVAFPTETVYGLGADATNDSAVAAIYAAKGRPQFNPLIVHVASAEEAKTYVEWNDHAQRLAEQYWPGPLTLVLARKKDCAISLLASAGLDTVAIRVPAHPLARDLLLHTGLPLAAPSANRSGKISPTLASHVAEELGDQVAMVLDGGACEVGIESTIVDVTAAPRILRHGKITREELQKLVPLAEQKADGKILAPGMMESHYAPDATVRLNATEVREGEALLAFGLLPSPSVGDASFSLSRMRERGGVRVENLSESGSLEEAAANLFRMLRALDAQKPTGIAVMPIPMEGLGVAINDRLARAAAPTN